MSKWSRNNLEKPTWAGWATYSATASVLPNVDSNMWVKPWCKFSILTSDPLITHQKEHNIPNNHLEDWKGLSLKICLNEAKHQYINKLGKLLKWICTWHAYIQIFIIRFVYIRCSRFLKILEVVPSIYILFSSKHKITLTFLE